MKPTVSIVLVTPRMADKWLASQERNRGLRDNRVMWLVRIIQRGEWKLTNDAISFDEEGHLLNGQHRLSAIVVAEQTAPLVVLRNLPVATQDVMDTGLHRKVADALMMRGEKNVFALASALRWEHRLRYIENEQIDHGNPVVHYSDGSERPSAVQLLAIFESDDDAWRDAAAFSQAHVYQLRGRYRPGIGAALRRRILDISEDDAAVFYDGLFTGAGLEAGSPILQLRNILAKETSNRRMPDYREAALVCKAWNLWRDGDQRGSLTWHFGGTQREPFPIPH